MAKVAGLPSEVAAAIPAPVAQVRIFAMDGRTIARPAPASLSNERRPPVALPYTTNWMVTAIPPMLSSALEPLSGRESGITGGNAHGGKTRNGQDEDGGDWDTEKKEKKGKKDGGD